jgi:hypothetical protein
MTEDELVEAAAQALWETERFGGLVTNKLPNTEWLQVARDRMWKELHTDGYEFYGDEVAYVEGKNDYRTQAKTVLAVARPIIAREAREAALREAYNQAADDCQEQADTLRECRFELLDKRCLGGRPVRDPEARKRMAHDFSKSADGAEGMVSFFRSKANNVAALLPEPPK